MFRYEVQFLGRHKDDYDRQLDAAANSELAGKIGFKSYYFAGIRGLIVQLETAGDCEAVRKAIPDNELVGTFEIARIEQAAA